MMGYKSFYLTHKEKLGGTKLVEIKSPFLDIADFICFADYLRSNKSFICISAVYCFYLDTVFPMLIAGILYFILIRSSACLRKNSADIIHSIDLLTLYRFACLRFSVGRTCYYIAGYRAV